MTKKFDLGNNNPLESSALFSGSDQAAPKKKKGKPQNPNLVRGKSIQEGLTKDYTRATFIVPVEQLDRLKNYAYTERISMKEAIERCLTEFLDSEEARLEDEGQEILDRNGGAE